MSPIKWTAIVILAIPLLHPSIARSGEWRVTPIRLDLGRDAKSGAIRVINEAQAKLLVQLKSLEWTQDEEGKDQYAETADLLFFPKMMTFETAEERIVRVGIRMPGLSKEMAYRLFIEEIPDTRKAEGVNVAIAIRFGVPIFIKPLSEEYRGELGAIGMANGNLNARVKNTGNVHFMVRSISWKGLNRKGEEIFSREQGGWYLLAGASRLYTTTLPGEVCPDLAKVVVEVSTDRTPLTGDFTADKKMCPP